MNPFKVDYTNLDEVIAFARKMAEQDPKYTQYVFKVSDRENYNITMQFDRIAKQGGVLVWSSSQSN